MYDLLLLQQSVRRRTLLVVVLARFLVGAFAPHVDCAALHGDAGLSAAAADADDGAIVENILDLVGCLLVRGRLCLLDVAEAQSLQAAFAPAVKVTRSRHCDAVGDTGHNVDDF